MGPKNSFTLPYWEVYWMFAVALSVNHLLQLNKSLFHCKSSISIYVTFMLHLCYTGINVTFMQHLRSYSSIQFAAKHASFQIVLIET